MLQRAYSKLEVKAVDEEQRIVEGLASTPATDRMDDVVEPMGAEFKLPVPFLWQHDSKQPVGSVVWAKRTKSGIPVRIQLARTDEPGPVKDRLDSAWQDIKLGLVRGLSIGFRALESAEIENSWGRRFTKWEMLELSGVTIPANAEATMAVIKSVDHEYRGTSDTAGSRPLVPVPVVFRGCDDPPPGSRPLASPGVSGTSPKRESKPEVAP